MLESLAPAVPSQELHVYLGSIREALSMLVSPRSRLGMGRWRRLCCGEGPKTPDQPLGETLVFLIKVALSIFNGAASISRNVVVEFGVGARTPSF